MSVEDNSDPEADALMPRALPVDLNAVDDCGDAPMTASQYISRVYMQATKLPKVVIAPHPNLENSNGTNEISSVDKERHERLHSEETLAAVSDNFTQTVQYLNAMRKKKPKPTNICLAGANNEWSWCCCLYEKQFASSVVDLTSLPRSIRRRPWCKALIRELKPDDSDLCQLSDDLDDESPSIVHEDSNEPEIPSKQMEPKLLTLVSLTQAHIHNLLEWHTVWFLEKPFTHHSLLWIFCLIAALIKPLQSDCIYILRKLAQMCAQQRQSLLDDDTVLCSTLIDELSVIICVVSRNFGQFDLED